MGRRLISSIYEYQKKRKRPEEMKPVNKQTGLVTSRNNESRKCKPIKHKLGPAI